MSDFDTRFGGIRRLYGAAGMNRLRAAHVAVVGIGGVGSWATEALVRSGIGRLSLIDLDEVCVSNMNRQLHALIDTVGRPKVEVMADRIRSINAECQVTSLPVFFTETNARELLSPGFDYVIDAIDSVGNKCGLIAECRRLAIPVIACGAAGGRRDATAIRVADLADVTHDRLLGEVRRRLRRDHAFPRGPGKFDVECVYSPEVPVFPHEDGSVCDTREEGADLRLNCDSGFGTATFVTGAFGFVAAGHVVSRIAGSI